MLLGRFMGKATQLQEYILTAMFQISIPLGSIHYFIAVFMVWLGLSTNQIIFPLQTPDFVWKMS